MSTHAGTHRAPVRVGLPDRVRDRMQDVVSQLAAAAGLIVVVVALTIASPYFLTANNLFNIGVQVSIVAIIAVGQTFVILTARDRPVGRFGRGPGRDPRHDGDRQGRLADRRRDHHRGARRRGRSAWSTDCSSRR